jgi:catechol 2,3-dioxygenase-like lactoylglutathione lyase family enzyme
MAARLDHLNVVVSDMERSIAFYQTLLGLAPIMDRRLDGAWFEQVTGILGAAARCVILDAPGGGCRIELLRFETLGAQALPSASLPSSIGLRHLAVRVDDLDACLERLTRTHGTAITPVHVPMDIVKSGKRMCYISDPDGAVVELCEYGGDKPEFC